MGSDPLDDVAARLYALRPEEFVAARDEAVARARVAGDRPLATRIAKLRKPTVGAWLVNLLAHTYPDLIAELLELGDRLRAAQRDLRGDELRELSVRRREAVGGLARRAAALARRRVRDGAPAGAPAVRGNLPIAEVEATLTAALAEPEVAEEVRAGRLTKTVAYDGFGEAPRPRLRLVQGGLDAPATTPAVVPPDIDVGRIGTGSVRAPGHYRPTSMDTGTERASTAERVAERAAERAERERRRRQRATAQRELLTARTQLAEAQAARSGAERAVTEAERRVEAAATALDALGDD